jgi:hypothetical protein
MTTMAKTFIASKSWLRRLAGTLAVIVTDDSANTNRQTNNLEK